MVISKRGQNETFEIFGQMNYRTTRKLYEKFIQHGAMHDWWRDISYFGNTENSLKNIFCGHLWSSLPPLDVIDCLAFENISASRLHRGQRHKIDDCSPNFDEKTTFNLSSVAEKVASKDKCRTGTQKW